MQFARGLGRHFAWLIFGAALGILDLVELQTGAGVSVPASLFWSVLAAGVLVAAFLAYHDLRTATASDVRLAARRIRDDFSQARHQLLELDVGDAFRVKAFMDDPTRHGLPTRGWEELAHLEATLSSEDYVVVRYAYVTIDNFNKTKGGVRVLSDTLKTDKVRQAIKRAEAVLP